MESNKVICGDILQVMKDIDNDSIDLVATDPPFNIGMEYDNYNDNIAISEYNEWTKKWIKDSHRVLKQSGSIFICINDEFLPETAVALKSSGFHFRNHIIWYYTFGENANSKFNRCHTNILYYCKNRKNMIFNDKDIRVPSARQWKYNDKRANSKGKIPDDAWEVPDIKKIAEIIRNNEDMRDRGISDANIEKTSEEITSLFIGDFWKVSRLCGTFSERIKDDNGSSHPCQMPLAIMKRIIQVSSNEGDVVLDPFCGTGTTLVAAKDLNRKFIGIDVSSKYADLSKKRLAI